MIKSVPLPDKRPYPESLQTVGNHIKRARLERRESIKDVLLQLGISRDTLRGWEHGIYQPKVIQFPKIILYLGYSPIVFNENTLSGRIKKYRYENGLTHKALGNIIGVRESMVWQWEVNGVIPAKSNHKRLNKLLNYK